MRRLPATSGLRSVLSFQLLTILAVAALLSGCGRSNPGREREAAAHKPAGLKSFVFYDVQARGGGDAVWGKKDGELFIQVVVPKGAAHQDELVEKRYHLKSRPGIFSEVELTVETRKLMALQLKKGSGDPRTILVLVPQAGPTVKVAREGDASDAGFDQLSSYLRGRCREVEAQEKPVYEGPYDKNWRPKGFERPW